jgi:hypothetical protein
MSQNGVGAKLIERIRQHAGPQIGNAKSNNTVRESRVVWYHAWTGHVRRNGDHLGDERREWAVLAALLIRISMDPAAMNSAWEADNGTGWRLTLNEVAPFAQCLLDLTIPHAARTDTPSICWKRWTNKVVASCL